MTSHVILDALRGFGSGMAAGGLLLAILFRLVIGSAPAHAETLPGDRIVILDGDTVALPCDPAKGLYPGCAEHIRFVTIDAPETFRPRCDAERPAGLAAKARLAELIRGHDVSIAREGRDRYGRTLARLTAIAPDGSTVDVEADLAAHGLALPYAPGRQAWGQRCRHWCPGAPRCEE